ncbi:hypothetical protein F5X68DRAFT_230291 [Plectosphaerella plurivora]|uniref:Rhodopsin domain-containing protein n=1 Tax=Plectosphaerella plurivora TaxID=936078 RepID=A0A9P9AEC7_9PEZI|nr:hypothetical protein F5X68DRAFT_230291 [Plectosphaerella plurivora]
MNGPTAAALLASFWGLLIIAALLIAARLWLRIQIQTKNLLLSDALLIISWFGSLVQAILAIVFASEGALHPRNDYTLLNWQADIKKMEHVTKLIWMGALAFFTSLYFCKFALLATFMQLFPRSMKALRIALYVTTAFCGCGYIITMASHIFICWPIEGNW